jgi:hypothetical protein
MSGTTRNSLAGLGSFGAFAAGVNLAEDERDRDQRFGITQRAIADDDYFRDSSAGILSGDQQALQGALARNPQRVAQMRGVQWAGEDRQRGEQERVLSGTARLTAALLGTDESQWGQLWPRVREQGMALGLQLPEQVPTRAQVEQVAAATRTPAQNLAADDARPRVGAPVGGGDWLDRLGVMESNNNPNARNPRSTATGAFQFIDGTWMQYAAANPDRFQGMSPEQILARRTDPQESRRAAEWYASQNGAALSAAGLPAGPGELALAHFAGPQGAQALLRANPNTPAGEVLGEAVMRANPQLAGRTAGQVVDIYRRRFGDAQPAAAEGGLPPGTRPLVDANGIEITRGNQRVVQLPDGRRTLVPLERAPPQNNVVLSPGQRMVGPDGREITRNDAPTAAQGRDGRLSTALVRMDEEDIERIQTASVIRADAQQFIEQLRNGRLSLSGAENLINRGRNFVGLSSENSRNYATFVASMERLRNDSLRLNTGVQTEGDAQRAWNELFANLNDEGVVRDQLQRIQTINERAAALRLAAMNRRRAEAGAQPVDVGQIGVPAPPSVGGQGVGQAGQQSQPAAQQPAQRQRLRFNPQTGELE